LRSQSEIAASGVSTLRAAAAGEIDDIDHWPAEAIKRLHAIVEREGAR
jgi:hypothetical protein